MKNFLCAFVEFWIGAVVCKPRFITTRPGGRRDAEIASPAQSCKFKKKFGLHIQLLTRVSKTAEDGDGNVGKTIKLITQDKKRT